MIQNTVDRLSVDQTRVAAKIGHNMNFQFQALPAGQFQHLAGHNDAELARLNVQRVVVDEKPGYPCRVSLVDAEIGETVYLLSHTHHDVMSPYRAVGPIYVRPDVPTARPGVNEIPAMFWHRLLSVRAYDGAAFLVEAEVVHGAALENTIKHLLADSRVAYLHIHNARPGCFNCRVVRA